MPTWPRKIGLGLAVFAAAIIVVLGSFVAFLHSGPGERWVSGKLEENVAGLELDGYHLNWPFRMRADYLRLMDARGTWLEITRPEFKWRPLRLLRGVLEIDRLAARRIDVLRPPAGGQSEGGGAPVELPGIALRLHDLSAPIVVGPSVLGERLELELGGSFLMQGGGGTVDVHLRAPGGSLVRLAGTAGWDYLDLRWYLRIADLSRWQRLAGTDLAGEVTGSGFVAGRLPDPVVSGRFEAGRGHAGALRWSMLELSGRVMPKTQSLALALRLAGQGLGIEGRTMPVDAATLSLVGDMMMDGGRVRLGVARLETAGATLAASGVLEQWGRQSVLRVKGVVADPARFGLPVEGRIMVAGRVAGDLPAMTLGGQLAVQAPGMSVGVAAVDRALGTRPKADIVFHAGGGLQILEAQVEGAAMRLRAAGSVGERLNLRASLSLPDLATVTGGVAGAATAEARVTGTAAGPDAFGEIRMSGVAAAGAPPGNGTVAFQIGTVVSAPSGPITANVTVGDVPIAGHARLAGTRLDGLELVSGDSRIGGQLALVDGGVRGHLSGSIADLSAWEALAGVPLAGQVHAEAELTPAAGQSLRLDLNGRNLAVAGTEVDSFSTLVTASGLTADAKQVAVESLRLTRSGADIVLLSPARLTLSGERAGLDWATLSLGEGRLHVQGHMRGNDLAAQLRIEGMPLDVAKLAMSGLDLTGRVDGVADLSGTLADPRIQAELTGRNVGLGAGAHAGVGRLAVRLSGVWQDGMLRAEGSANDGDRLRASAEATLPVPGEGMIAGWARASGDAGRLSEMLPFPGHVLTGGLQASAEVSGTLAEPLVSGQVSLDNGRYENLENGTLVTSLSVRAEIAGDNVTINASGMDGGNGSVRVQGQGSLAGAYQGEVTLNNFTALRRDDAEAQLDGGVHLAGEGGQGRIAGDLTVPRAEVDIGRLKGGGPVTLDVIEINKPGQGPPPARQPDAAETPLTIALAVDVTVEHAFVRSRGLDSEWQGGVTVGGTLTQPSLTGQLKVARGNFDFLGKQFALVPDSAVTFQGGDSIDPALNVTAEVAATDITAQVQVSGTAKQPGFAMTSSPTLPQDEILARVLFGRELGKLSTFQQIQLAQMAASGLTGGGGGGLRPHRRRARPAGAGRAGCRLGG